MQPAHINISATISSTTAHRSLGSPFDVINFKLLASFHKLDRLRHFFDLRASSVYINLAASVSRSNRFYVQKTPTIICRFVCISDHFSVWKVSNFISCCVDVFKQPVLRLNGYHQYISLRLCLQATCPVVKRLLSLYLTASVYTSNLPYS